MDNNRQYIADNFDNMAIGLDDTFTFSCNQCGKCCINREDILLNPYDLFRMSHELNMTPLDFHNNYCESYVGDSSLMVVVRLKPRGEIKRCPMLKDRKCMIHNAKPAVCALYPLGRGIKANVFKSGKLIKTPTTSDIQYINQDNCGNGKPEEHKVRDWLEHFNIPIEDEFFVKWQITLTKISALMHKLKKRQSPQVNLSTVYDVIFMTIYLHYDHEKEFMPQFNENVDILFDIINKFYFDGKAAVLK